MTSGAVRRNRHRMTRAIGLAPSADEIEALARAALARLPARFREHLDDVVLLVEEFADEELLHEKSIGHSGTLPDRIRLFRAPILDEWIARGDETLEHLVAHVLVHEVGHHFGLSDEAMHALEDAATD